MAKEIWGFAEVGYQEQKSSTLLQRQLEITGAVYNVLPTPISAA